MPTYVYETIPSKPGAKALRFELRQSMRDPALTKHPETGEPVRRVISGGYGVIEKAAAPSSGGCCHGGSCGCG